MKTLSIESGAPWENGYVESFHGRLRDELLAREEFDSLLESKALIERWRKASNTVRPRGALGNRTPSEVARPVVGMPIYRPCMAYNSAGTKLGAASEGESLT